MNKYFKISENDFLFVPILQKIPDTLEDEEVLVPVLHHLGAGRPHAQHQLPGRGRGRHQREQGGGRGEGGDQTGHGYEGSRPAHLAHVQGVSIVLAGAQCTGCLYYPCAAVHQHGAAGLAAAELLDPGDGMQQGGGGGGHGVVPPPGHLHTLTMATWHLLSWAHLYLGHCPGGGVQGVAPAEAQNPGGHLLILILTLKPHLSLSTLSSSL